MFKVRMQGQYGGKDDKRLRVVMREMWKEWGFRQGIMRGYWVRPPEHLLVGCRDLILHPGHIRQRNPRLRRVYTFFLHSYAAFC